MKQELRSGSRDHGEAADAAPFTLQGGCEPPQGWQLAEDPRLAGRTAQAVAFLHSDDASCINGIDLRLDDPPIS